MKLLSLALSFLLWAGVAQAQPLTPIAGIPTPEFGITEVAPAPTLFINEATGSDTNPGTQVAPRKTLPAYIAPCTSVRIVGRYTKSHSSPYPLTALGLATCPVWITGGEITAYNEIAGTYLFIEGVKFGPGFVVIRDFANATPSHHIVFRNNEMFGNNAGGGLGVQAFAQSALSDIVIWRNYIHDVGNMNTTTDQDALCVGIYRDNITRVWALENVWAQCSSDGIQVNATAQGNWRSLNHVYIGRNYCYHNRQGCAWTKEAADVVISENICHGMRPDAGGLNPGHCYGGQYGTERLAIINNVAFDSENGIVLASYNEGFGVGTIIAGNLIYNIHHTTTADDINNPWSGGAAMRFAGGGHNCFDESGDQNIPCVVVFNNTVYDTDGGIQIPAGGATVLSFNNIFSDQDRAVVQLEAGGLLSVHDQIDTAIGAPFYTPILGAPTFVAPATGDFRLTPESVGKGVGAEVEFPPLDISYLAPVDMGANKSFTIPTPPPHCNAFWLLFGIRIPAGCIN